MFEGVEFEEMAKPGVDELAAFYERQAYKATESREKLRRMLENTFCCVTARRDGARKGALKPGRRQDRNGGDRKINESLGGGS